MGCKKEEVAENVLYPSGTQLSPYLRFGCISSRLYYHRLTMAYMKVGGQKVCLLHSSAHKTKECTHNKKVKNYECSLLWFMFLTLNAS